MEATPYVKQVIEEAMRLYPPVGMLARNVRSADTLSGREILPNDVLFLPIYALYRHHMWWELPNEFDPDRFSPEAVRARDRYLYLPFGAGPRVCVGANFAMMQAHIILATLLVRFRFELGPNSLPMPTIITATPDGDVYFVLLAGSYLASIDRNSGEARVIESPTPDQGARRVWSDSRGRLWISEWNSGQISVYDPHDGSWNAWRLPGDLPRAYAVYVDERDIVWLRFRRDAVHAFDPQTDKFTTYPKWTENANVRQINGRRGEVWLPESGADRLVVIRAVSAK